MGNLIPVEIANFGKGKFWERMFGHSEFWKSFWKIKVPQDRNFGKLEFWKIRVSRTANFKESKFSGCRFEILGRLNFGKPGFRGWKNKKKSNFPVVGLKF